MKIEITFDEYLKKFLTQEIHGLPKSFGSIQHYRDTCMFLFDKWLLLKKFSEYSSPQYKRLEDLLNKIDQFDNTLSRPLEINTIRAIEHNAVWREIHKEIQMLNFL